MHWTRKRALAEFATINFEILKGFRTSEWLGMCGTALLYFCLLYIFIILLIILLLLLLFFVIIVIYFYCCYYYFFFNGYIYICMYTYVYSDRYTFRLVEEVQVRRSFGESCSGSRRRFWEVS